MRHTTAAALFLVAAACKTPALRNAGLKDTEAAAALLDLKSAPPDAVADVCAQRQFFFFAGNAESLGEVVIPKGLEAYFSGQKAWRATEWERESSYHGKVRKQLFNLVTALARPDAACFSPAVVERLKAKQVLGSVTLVGLVDGPNIKDAKGTLETGGDSYLQSWHFGFTDAAAPQLGWTVRGPYFWTISGGKVSPQPVAGGAYGGIPASIDSYLTTIPAGARFEAAMDQAVDAVIAARETFGALHFSDGRAFTQVHYAFKSHGAQVTAHDVLSASPDIGRVLEGQLNPFAESAFLFDSFRPLPNGKNGWDAGAGGYVQPLWSTRGACRYQALGDSEVLTATENAKYKACLKTAEAQAKEVFGAPKTGQGVGSLGNDQGAGIPGNDQGAGNPGNDQGAGNPGNDQGAGNPGNDQGAGNPGNDQGAGNPGNDQGAGSPGNDQGAGNPGNDQGAGNPGNAQGAGNPGNDQGAGSLGNDQGPDGLVLGPGIWNGATQGSKGFVFAAASAASKGTASPELSEIYKNGGLTPHNVRAKDRRSDPDVHLKPEAVQAGASTAIFTTPTNVEAQAFRFLGRGKSLSYRVTDDRRLRLALGTTSPGVALFDTCYANFTPAKPSASIAATKTINTLSVLPAAQRAKGELVLSNPAPLLIDAIDYGRLNAFQYSYLAINGDDQKNAAVANALGSLRGPYAPLEKDSDAIKSRLLSTFQLCPGPADGATDCIANSFNTDLMIWERLFHIAKALNSQMRLETEPRTNSWDPVAFYDTAQLPSLWNDTEDRQQLSLRIIGTVVTAARLANLLRSSDPVPGQPAAALAAYNQWRAARKLWSSLTGGYFSSLETRFTKLGFDGPSMRAFLVRDAFRLLYLTLSLVGPDLNPTYASLDASIGIAADIAIDKRRADYVRNFEVTWSLFERVRADPPPNEEAKAYLAEIAAIAPDPAFLAEIAAARDQKDWAKIRKMALERLGASQP